MGVNTTTFRALRTFYLRGVGDIARGALLQLTDAEAQSLIWMSNTIEPVEKADRCRVLVDPVVTWGRPKKERNGDSVADRKPRPRIAA